MSFNSTDCAKVGDVLLRIQSSLVYSFEKLVSLTGDERAFLMRLEAQESRYLRKTCLWSAGDVTTRFYVLKKGWAMSSNELASGGRQISRLHFPGDVLGFPSLGMREATDTLTAVSDIIVASFDKLALGRLFEEHPRLAALFFVISQDENVRLVDRIVSLGQTTAISRIAAVLIHIADRLRVIDPAVDSTIPLPLTQEELGHMTGLTSVHVNRTLRVMDEQGLLLRQNGKVTFLDEAALRVLAELFQRTRCGDFAWLPTPT